MGLRGPAPRPLELLTARGERSHHKQNDAAPIPRRTKKAKAPFRLCRLARKIWRTVSEQLERLDMLAETDLLSLAKYCDIHARWLKLRDFLDEHDYSFSMQTEKGGCYICVRPEVGLFNRLGAQLTKYEQEFGLTPASRTRIRVDRGVDKNKSRARLYGDE